MEGLETTAADLRRAVTRLGQRLRHGRAAGALPGTQLGIVGHLHRHGECSPGQVARALHQQPQSLTKALAELELAGLLTRRPSPTDRRESLLTLTDSGRHALYDDMAQRDRWLTGALSGLGPTELGVLRLAAAILEELAETVPDAMPGAGPGVEVASA